MIKIYYLKFPRTNRNVKKKKKKKNQNTKE